MPFFLSQKRNTGAPRGTQQLSSDFVRAAPSAFRYYPYTVIHLSLFLITRFFASVFAMSQIAYFNKNKTVVSQGMTKTTFPALKKDKMLPINNPDGALAFPRSYHLLPAERSFLDKYQATVATPIFRGRKQFLIHLLPRLQNADLKKFMEFETKMTNVVAPADSLTPLGYAAYIDLLSIISGLFIYFHTSIVPYGHSAGSSYIGSVLKTEGRDEVFKNPLTVMPDGSFHEVTDTSVKATFLQTLKEGETVLVQTYSPTNAVAWGTMMDCHFNEGLAAPYRKDFSTPDPNMFNQFARIFWPMMDKSSVDDDVDGLDSYLEWLERWWRDEIANTTQGEWMAHMMKLLVLAHELGCNVFAVISAGIYHGCVLGGGKWKLQVGKEVFVPKTGKNFEEEEKAMDMHGSAMDKILDLLAIAKPRAAPNSMRRLREMAITSNLSPSVKAQISELLPSLDFGTYPDNPNASTIKDTFRLLCNPLMGIPIGMYMAPSSFWTTDRFEEILSRFGTRVPSIQTGTKKYKLCSLAHGTGSLSAVPYTTDGPSLLQFQLVPVAKAVADYRYNLSGGLASMETTTELTGHKLSLRGIAAKDTWGVITGYVYQYMQQDEGQGAVTGDQKRGRDDGEEGYEEGEIPSAPKKKKKFNPFEV